jgi:hypothetical protein
MLKKEIAAKSNPIIAHTGAIINKSIFSRSLLLKSRILLEKFYSNILMSRLKKQSHIAGFTG